MRNLLMCAGALAIATGAAHAQYGIYTLLNRRSGISVSDKGDVVLTAQDTNSHSVLWNRSSGVTATLPPEFSPVTISSDGSTVLGMDNSNHATIWTPQAGLFRIPSPNGQLVNASVGGISANGGKVLVNSSASGHQMVFAWDAATNTSQWILDSASAIALSRDGSIAVGSNWATNPTSSFRYDTTGFHNLGTSGPNQTFASGLSSDTSVMIANARNGNTYFSLRWTASGGYEFIGGIPSGPYGNQALGVNSDGSVIVGTLSGDRAYIWDRANGIRDLNTVLPSVYGINLNGWLLREADAISPDGHIIAGTAEAPDGQSQAAFVAYIPGPAAPVAVIAGIALSTVRRRRAGRVHFLP